MLRILSAIVVLVSVTTANASVFLSYNDGQRSFGASTEQYGSQYQLFLSFDSIADSVSQAGVWYSRSYYDPQVVNVAMNVSGIRNDDPKNTDRHSQSMSVGIDGRRYSASAATGWYQGGGKGDSLDIEYPAYTYGNTSFMFDSFGIESYKSQGYFDEYLNEYDGITYFNLSAHWQFWFTTETLAQSFYNSAPEVSAVPEPASLSIVTLIGLGLLARRRRN